MKWAMATPSIEQGLQTGEIKCLFSDRQNVDTDYVTSLAKVKRFLERWAADRQFREGLCVDPYDVTRRYNLEVDPEEIRLLWDLEAVKVHDPDAAIPLKVKCYELFVREKILYRDTIRKAATPSNSSFRAWRERQVYRTFSEFGVDKADNIIHAPFSIELSKGCSVGCWFCGVAAPRLEDIFTYSQENARLWREVLAVLSEVIGPAASHGFCYWASDPLDNPDYEQFLVDFHAILGQFPQTTTALAMKNPQRTRDLLKLSAEKGGDIERFSLLTLRLLDQIHQEFSPEELIFVELVCQNGGALGRKAVAGRAREERFRKRLEAESQSVRSVDTGTIACVSGFLLNMVDRSVRLISPCNADDRWPLGYRIYEQAVFKTACELRTVLEQMIKRHMSSTVSLQDQIRFRPDLRFEKVDDGFHLSTPLTRHSFSGTPHIQEVGEALLQKQRTAAEFALLLEADKGIPLPETLHYLNEFFKHAVLDEEIRIDAVL